MRQLKQILRSYGRLILTLAILIASLIMSNLELRSYANWLAGVSAACLTLPSLANLWQSWRHGESGIDALGLIAMIAALVYAQDLTAIALAAVIQAVDKTNHRLASLPGQPLPELTDAKPKSANIIRGRKTISSSIDAIRAGDKLAVNEQEIVPVDAVLVSDAVSAVSPLWEGEKTFNSGELIPAGSMLNMAAELKAQASYSDSHLSLITKQLNVGIATRSRFDRSTAKLSFFYSLSCLAIGGVSWWTSHQEYRFVAILLAGQVAQFMLIPVYIEGLTLKRAIVNHFLIRHGIALETLDQSETLVINKGGVLTEADFRFDSINAIKPYSQDEVLALAAAAEQNSSHPIAIAIRQAVAKRKLKVAKLKTIKEVGGLGIIASHRGDTILVGGGGLISSEKVSLPKLSLNSDLSPIYVAINQRLAGVILLASEQNADSRRLLSRLRKIGIDRTVLTTGDGKDVAQSLAKKLAIKTVYAETMPGEKLHALEDLPERPIAFISDGQSERSTQNAADVAIVVNALSSDAASLSAGVLVYDGGLLTAAKAFEQAHQCYKVIKRSIWLTTLVSIGLMVFYATGWVKPLYATPTSLVLLWLAVSLGDPRSLKMAYYQRRNDR